MTVETEPRATAAMPRGLRRADDSGADDAFSFVDHISRFGGLAVAQLYILCAGVTVYEVIARYVFNAPTQWAFEIAMVLCATRGCCPRVRDTAEAAYRHHGLLPDGQRAGAVVARPVCHGVGCVALFLSSRCSGAGTGIHRPGRARRGRVQLAPADCMLKTVLVARCVHLSDPACGEPARGISRASRAHESVLLMRALLVRLLPWAQHYTRARIASRRHQRDFRASGDGFQPAEYRNP